MYYLQNYNTTQKAVVFLKVIPTYPKGNSDFVEWGIEPS